MGASPSKDEKLYQEVQNGNHDAVKSLFRGGASLEWRDKEGRTPLLLACSRGELLDMAITLLNLGADLNAYKSGAHGGYPLHQAAKRGLDRTVALLLSRGVDSLAVNDDNHTPLEMARSRGHTAVVRLLEERLCLFSGMLRELSGLSVLESIAPNLVTKKVWIVVLPSKSVQGKPPVFELAIYEPPKINLWNGVHSSSAHPAGSCNVAHPRTVILLSNADIEEPDNTSVDPVLYITDKRHKSKYKLLSENKGERSELLKLYTTCKGILDDQNGSCDTDSNTPNTAGNVSQIHPISIQPVLNSVSAPSTIIEKSSTVSIDESIPEDVALALALKESIRTATEEGISISSDASSTSSINEYKGSWDVQDTSSYMSWDAFALSKSEEYSRDHDEWYPAESRVCCTDEDHIAWRRSPTPVVQVQDAKVQSTRAKKDNKCGGTCVICWDAPSAGVCIPCGHLAACMECLTEIKSKGWGCPVCRGPIDQVIKVYAV